MKKIFIIALAAVAMVSCGSATKYTITGTAEEFTDGKWAFLGKQQGREFVKSDSVQIAGNSFTLNGEVEAPYSAYIAIGEPNARPDMYIEVVVEPGKIEVKKLNPEHRSYTAVGTVLNDKLAELNNKIWDLEKNDGSEEEYIALQKSFIEENIDNTLGLNTFKGTYYYFKPQDVINIINAMPAAAQEELASTKQSAEQALKVEPGNNYVDVVEPTPDGKELSLKSVIENKNNKYVLLDFWASWCGPCMAEVPYLVETYKNFHKKGFEIYGVSFDRDRDAWLKAIKEKELNWLHVSNVKYWDTPSRHAYAVNSIPANFLIDCSTGKIIAKGLRGEEVQKKIAELLK